MPTTKQKIPTVRSAHRKVSEASTQLEKVGLPKLAERADKLATAIGDVLSRMDKATARPKKRTRG